MNNINGDENIEIRVLLLGIYKALDGETINDILKTMENTRVFDAKTGKKHIQVLKELNYINDDGLTFIGIEKAKEVEREFTI